MVSFADLSSEDRWALAFYVGTFAFPAADAGEQIWATVPAVRQAVPNIQTLTQMTPTTLSEQIGQNQALALIAYLRRHPEATMQPSTDGTLVIARQRLVDSIDAYVAGDRLKAADLALAAYLDGFEPVEPILKARDAALVQRVEVGMGDFRAAIKANASLAELRGQADHMAALFGAAENALAVKNASTGSSFIGAFTILLREGIEALLIVVAMIAFLRKAERGDVLPYVHGGWIAALLAGGLTWFAATYLISISGASRELTEGFGSLLAAAVLVSVGVWMHGKAQADAWQTYIREKLTNALSGRSAWFLFLLAFVVVYREVFETILFYAALWNQGAALAMFAGAATAGALLGIAAWALLTYSRRLPISQFFSLSSILMAVLAVVLAGKGVAALQEAGLLDIQPLHNLPRIEMLGLYPTVEGVFSQLFTLISIVLGFWVTGRAKLQTLRKLN